MSKNRKNDFDKEFSQSIDRMLAGKRIEPCADMPDDYRETIDFAQKLINLKGGPRPSFKAQLKDNLLSKLSQTEQERSGRIHFRERLSHLIPQRPVWQAVAASLLVIVVAGGVILGTGVFTQPMPPPCETLLPTPRQPVTLKLTSVKTTYSPGGEAGFIRSETTIVTHLPPQMATTPFETERWKETVWYSLTNYRKPNLRPEVSMKYDTVWTIENY